MGIVDIPFAPIRENSPFGSLIVCIVDCLRCFPILKVQVKAFRFKKPLLLFAGKYCIVRKIVGDPIVASFENFKRAIAEFF